MATVNRSITLAARPVGFPGISDFRLEYSPLPSPAAGEVLVRSAYLALDPWIRGRMGGAGANGGQIAIGGVLPGAVAGSVVESRDPRFRAGDAVEGMLGWQEYGAAAGASLRKLDPTLAPISTALGVLGLPGLTAYFGLLDVCAPRRGETVVVSGAAGAVGMVAGQIARIRGCRVVGIAGSGARVSWLLDELGFDAAFSQGTDADVQSRLDELCPEGIDVYLDTLGGTVSDAVLHRINAGARVSVCGQLSQDNLETPETGPRWLGQLIPTEAKVQGFLVSSCVERHPDGLAQLAGWLNQGTLKYREDVAWGIEAAPQAFIAMLQGKNLAPQLVQFADSSPRPHGSR